MQLSPQLLKGLQNRLKIGNRRGAHLNALPGRSRYKLDLHRLEALAPGSSQQFLEDLLRKADFQFSLQINQRSKDFLQRPPEQQQQLLQLQRSLENLAYQTEAIELEKGIQSLGLGFPLLVRRNWKDGRLILAPLFIWTLRIRQSGDFTSWRLQRREDDPILFNEVLLNHLRADGGFSLQGMPEEMTEKGYLSEEDVLKLSEELLNNINQHTEAAHFDLLRMKLTELHPIRPKEEYETILQDHPESAYIHRGALLSIFELQKQSIISDFDDLLAMDDLELPAALTEPPSFQSISSVPTDPSQQKVLHALEAGHNLLIQGPPGTGKSQILTATLVNALENGRHCLVVCEKRTALEVLHQALVERGLGEHCVLIKDSSKDRSTVVNSVRDRLDQYQNKRHRSTHSRQGLEYILRACRRHIATINAQHQRVGERQLMGHNWTEAVGMLLRELAGEEEPPRLQFDPAWFRFKDAEWDRLRQMAREGQALYKDFGSRPDMDFYQRYKFQGEQPFLVERQLTEAFDNYRQQLEDIRLDMAQYKTEYYRLRREAFRREEQKIKGCIHNIRQIYDQHQYDPDFLEENHKSDWLFRLAVLFSAQRKASLRSQQEVRQLFGKLQQLIGRQQGLSALSGGRDLRTAYDELEEWQKEFSSWSNDWDDLIRKKLEEMDVHNIAPSFQTEHLRQLQQKMRALDRQLAADDWCRPRPAGGTFQEWDASWLALLDRQANVLPSSADFPKLFKWFRFLHRLSEAEQSLLFQVQGHDNWEHALFLFYVDALLQRKGHFELPTDEKAHELLTKEMASLEEEQLNCIRAYWITRQMAAARGFDRTEGLSVKNLYNKRRSHKHRRLSLRLIVRWAPELFRTFFPILLTTPDACSNLFRGQINSFDLVLFDESSQLRLEDTLPALLKGRQKIIAGDEHQMPPSNYFSRLFDGELNDQEELEEEDFHYERDDVLLSCESLLDFGQECQFDKQYLDFHYRSRHPHLIDFSNQAFYNGRLRPLPQRKQSQAIRFFQVNGTYDQHTNEAEVDRILHTLEHDIQANADGTYPSVGIATLNISQRNRIKRALARHRRRKDGKDFDEKMRQLEAGGLFIKNLENIQGDERDVLLLSTTYGPDKQGRFYQRFGPLNHRKGYQLLNVIITRARDQIHLFTSIPEDIYLDYRTHLAEMGNHRKAVFFAYLAYARAASEADEPARQEVLTALAANQTVAITGEPELPASVFANELAQLLTGTYGPDSVQLQATFGGFVIDVLFDPGLPGWPGIAIECDGAKAHLEREAYLYDLHRKSILEGEGFVFHRLWSTLWWRDRTKAAADLLAFIDKELARHR